MSVFITTFVFIYQYIFLCLSQHLPVFSPTPRVDWDRVDGEMPSRSRRESFGQELVVENVQFEDAGKYECQGINDENQTPERRSFELKIECKFYIWGISSRSGSIENLIKLVFTKSELIDCKFNQLLLY